MVTNWKYTRGVYPGVTGDLYPSEICTPRYIFPSKYVPLGNNFTSKFAPPLWKYVPPTEVHQKWILKGLSILSDRWALGIAHRDSLRVIFLSFSARVLFLCFRLLDPISR